MAADFPRESKTLCVCLIHQLLMLFTDVLGGDKVLGLQGCVAFAQRWYQACEDNVSTSAALSSFY